MKTFLKFTVLSAVLLSLTLVFLSCDNKQDIPPEKPTETPFVLSLVGTSCHWINLAHDNNLIIINSKEELKNYINCTDDNFPEIDFSEHTLLIASGIINQGISSITKKLQLTSPYIYQLNMEILLNDTTVMQNWVVALVINKISDNSRIKLNIKIIRN